MHVMVQIDITSPEFTPPGTLPHPEDMRSHPLYKTHLYWAKKPWNVIAACIEHFSRPGEIVLDPFCGCGSTAFEALRLKRKVIALDLNPLSVFITKMFVRPYMPEYLTKDCEDVFLKIKEIVMQRIYDLYQTICTRCGKTGIAITTVFNSINNEDDPRKREWKIIKVRYKCNSCGVNWKNNRLSLDERAQEISLSKYNFPRLRLLHNTRINIYDGMTVADIYTRRNLAAMSILKEAIFSLRDGDCKDLMKFIFSGLVRLSSMTMHVKGGEPQNFYIPKKEMVERNVWDMFERKKKEVFEAKLWSWPRIGPNYKEATSFYDIVEGQASILVTQCDVQNLGDLLPEESVHYIHTDPPYADQVPYMEISLPWIGWLELLDEATIKEKLKQEIVLTDSPERPDKHRVTQEGVKDYYELLGNAVEQMYRALKPKRWASIWYCCSKEEYWRALSDHLNTTGLERRGVPHIVIRRAKTFKFAITRAKVPLSRVRDSEHLIHCQKTGVKVPIRRIAEQEAVQLYLEIAEMETRKKGAVSIDEVLIPFYASCLARYGNPPPDLNYVGLLEKDPRFEIVRTSERVNSEYAEIVKISLKNFKYPGKLDFY